MIRTHWDKTEWERYFKLVDSMALEVVKGSPLLKYSDKTSVGLVLTKIAYGVVEAENQYFGEMVHNDMLKEDLLKKKSKIEIVSKDKQ